VGKVSIGESHLEILWLDFFLGKSNQLKGEDHWFCVGSKLEQCIRIHSIYHILERICMFLEVFGKETALFVWLISHQPTVLLSQNKPGTSNQPAVLLSQNKPAPAISHQPNEQAADLQFLLCTC
jgi:hypothetical protein